MHSTPSNKPTHRPPTWVLSALVLVACLTAAPAHAATILVTTLNDETAVNGECSMREAVIAANEDAGTDCANGAGEDLIEFSVTGTILLDSALVLTEGLNVMAPSAGSVTFDAQGLDRVFEISAPTANFNFNGLILQNGSALDGACVYAEATQLFVFQTHFLNCHATRGGGAIHMESGNLIVVASHFDANQAVAAGGAIALIAGTHGVIATSFVGNTVTGSSGRGGAIVLAGAGVLSASTSTFHGNQAGGSGGAIHADNATALEVVECTVTNNAADIDVDGSGPDSGGGIYTDGDLDLRGSIIAGNVDSSTSPEFAPDLFVAGDLLTSGGNFIGRNATVESDLPAGQPNANFDFVGTTSAPLSAQLSPVVLRQDGTASRLPVTGADNPLIDQGNCNGAADQRGLPRFVDGPPQRGLGCDIGAAEVQYLFWDGFESGTVEFWSP